MSVVWYSAEMTCPACKARLCGRHVGGGFAVGQDSDLLVRMKGKHIIQAEIHTCQNCRYSGFVRDFNINMPPRIGETFCAEVTPTLLGGPKTSISSTPLPDVQYEWAHQSAAFLNRPSKMLGEMLLRAYWSLRLSPSSHLVVTERVRRKKKYLTGCVRHYRQSLRGNRNPYLYYLLGELNRRLGVFDDANGFFDKFLAKSKTFKYLRFAASNLLAMSKDENSIGITMEELIHERK